MAKQVQFARIRGGDYQKLEAAINNSTIKFPAYVYDEAAQRLIWVNQDKTYNYIKGDSDAYTIIEGTPENPVQIQGLDDGLYMLIGNYEIPNMDVDFNATATIMVAIETIVDETSLESTTYATLYTSNGLTVYKIQGETTTIDRPVMEEEVVGIINTQVEATVPTMIESAVPDIMEETMVPVPDADIDALFPGLQPTSGGE